jgi:hypothetical protein
VSDERLRDLYAAALEAGVTTTGGSHPSPEAIADLVNRTGAEAERLATLDHVMSCAECRRDFDLLRTVERVAGGASRPVARPSWVLPSALAATLLVAIGIGRTMLTSDDDVTRGNEGASVVLVAPGAEVPAGAPLVFTWRKVPDATRYEIELLDVGGNVAASAATTDTTASPASAPGLPPGEYRWWVRATTADARSLRSSLRPLRLTAR